MVITEGEGTLEAVLARLAALEERNVALEGRNAGLERKVAALEAAPRSDAPPTGAPARVTRRAWLRRAAGPRWPWWSRGLRWSGAPRAPRRITAAPAR